MKFSEEKPTVPGAYWWRPNEKFSSELVQFVLPDEAKYQDGSTGLWSKLFGQWSSRLVPVCEVEAAFEEGQAHEVDADGIHFTPFDRSRARRVVEGREP